MLATSLVLCAAVLHATWNTLVKFSSDRLLVVACMDVVGVLLRHPAVALRQPAAGRSLALAARRHRPATALPGTVDRGLQGRRPGPGLSADARAVAAGGAGPDPGVRRRAAQRPADPRHPVDPLRHALPALGRRRFAAALADPAGGAADRPVHRRLHLERRQRPESAGRWRWTTWSG
ncbi:hypothetical protein ACPA9J_35090 [Pseudomonas aeruginosa]